MSYLPILIFFLVVFLFFYMNTKRRNNEIEKKIAFNDDLLSDQIVARKNFVKCETYTSGRKTSAYRFNTCDLIFLKDSFVIIGYDDFGNSKNFTNYLKFTNGLVNDRDKLKKINLNSFGNDVYIEFGESSFSSTNVEIRLKNLTEEKKKLIKVN